MMVQMLHVWVNINKNIIWQKFFYKKLLLECSHKCSTCSDPTDLTVCDACSDTTNRTLANSCACNAGFIDDGVNGTCVGKIFNQILDILYQNKLIYKKKACDYRCA